MMDIKKYISSGILEQYVLGLVSEKDRKEVEQYMDQYPEIKKEVETIEKALEKYAEANKIKASSGLEESIMSEIENTPRDLPNPVADKPVEKSAGLWSYLLGALLIGALILSWWFYSQNQKTQKMLEDQKSTFQELQADCNDKDERINRLNEQMEVLLNTNNQQYEMKGEQALATVFYNATSKKSYLNVGSLAAAPSNKKYELWALVNGQPVSMGNFEILNNGDTLINVPFIENAGAFAVTLELPDGNPAPNLNELVVISDT